MESGFAMAVNEIARVCAVGCVAQFHPDMVTCTAECMVQRNADLSLGCSICYAAKYECRADHCGGACAGGEGTPACDGCLGQHCLVAWQACSGLDALP